MRSAPEIFTNICNRPPTSDPESIWGTSSVSHVVLDNSFKRSVSLNDEGVAEVEKVLGLDNLYDPSNIETLHHVNQGLKAHVLFKTVIKDRGN